MTNGVGRICCPHGGIYTGCGACRGALLDAGSLQAPSSSKAEGCLQPALAFLQLHLKVAGSFSHPNNNCVPSIRLLIALGLLGLHSALKALSGWLALLVKLALENHKYSNPALLCPADMFLMQFLCSSGQSCLSAPLSPG